VGAAFASTTRSLLYSTYLALHATIIADAQHSPHSTMAFTVPLGVVVVLLAALAGLDGRFVDGAGDGWFGWDRLGRRDRWFCYRRFSPSAFAPAFALRWLLDCCALEPSTMPVVDHHSSPADDATRGATSHAAAFLRVAQQNAGSGRGDAAKSSRRRSVAGRAVPLWCCGLSRLRPRGEPFPAV